MFRMFYVNTLWETKLTYVKKGKKKHILPVIKLNWLLVSPYKREKVYEE